MRIARTRGAVSGALLVILGLWGGLIPLVGPSFDYTIGPDRSWDLTTGRLWLSLLPAIAVLIGGVLLIVSRHRAIAGLGAWLGIAGGAWFAVGQAFSALWNHGASQAGHALGTTGHRVAEELGYFYGLGVLTAAIAAFALGRLAVRSVRDAELAAAAPAGPAEDQARRGLGERGRFDRDRDPEREPVTTSDGPSTTTSGERRSGLFRR
jgi:hypothetical protein